MFEHTHTNVDKNSMSAGLLATRTMYHSFVISFMPVHQDHLQFSHKINKNVFLLIVQVSLIPFPSNAEFRSHQVLKESPSRPKT